MYLVQILLPLTDNSGKRFQVQFDDLSEDLARSFHGVTAYLRSPAEGIWRDGDRQSEEDIVIFEVMVDQLDLDAWRQRRKDLERLFPPGRIASRPVPITPSAKIANANAPATGSGPRRPGSSTRCR